MTGTLTNRWIKYFWNDAKNAASMSKDANTKVGAVIFSPELKISISSGWNDIPRNVKHTVERNTRPLKYKYTVHAEANAIVNAARTGRSTDGSHLVVNLFPCSLCAGLIINAGVCKLYSVKPDFNHVKYGEDMRISLEMFREAGVELEYLKPEELDNEQND